MQVSEKLADLNGYSGRTKKRIITACYLNVTYADWYVHAEKPRGAQVYLNRLAWENG